MHLNDKCYFNAAAGTALMLAMSAAWADGVTTSISGFGTVGGSFTGDSKYTYIHDSSEFTGASNQFDIGLDSRLGVQASFDFGSGFSVTAQEVARERGATAFDLGTEWLYAQYAPSSDWKLRVGRVALAVFLYSDSKFVGYAAPWFHAPNSVYSAEPFNYVDGGEVVWRKNFGEFGLKAQAAYGTTQVDLILNGQSFKSTAHDVLNAAISLEYGSFLVRLAETNLISPVSLPLSATYIISFGVHDTFKSIGFQYDNGTAIVLGEYTMRRENDAPVLNEPISKENSWYVAGGWRFGKLTPLLTYAVADPKASLFAPVPASYASESLSLRYDVVSNIALKAQVSRAKGSDSSYFTGASVPASDKYVNVFGLGADFVF